MQRPAAPLATRRAALGFLGGLAVLPTRAAPAAQAPPPPPAREPAHPDIVVANPAVLAGLNARDEAAGFKCKGGMMDCDGDRREFAKKQYEKFKKRMDGGEAGRPAGAEK